MGESARHPVREAVRGPAALLFAAFLALWLGFAQAALAQAVAEPDYAAWDRFASSIEAVVDAGSASDAELQALRDEAVEWREGFLQAQSINAPRIATLRDQIAALGPAPAEGESEAEDVAARRADLNAQLAELQAPGVRAGEAFSRAASLVQTIDEQQRERQTTAILRLSPSPLLPSSLSAAATEGMAVLRGFADDYRERSDAGKLPERWPEVVLYLALAALLLFRVRTWMDSLPLRLSARASDYSRDAVRFIASLGQIVVPVLGVYLAVRALDATGLVGDWGRPVLIALPGAGLLLFGGRWLAGRFFPLHSDPPICYPDPQLNRGRLYGTALAATLAAHDIAGRAFLPQSGLYEATRADGDAIPLRLSDAASGVWHLPLILLGAIFLYKLSLILRSSNRYATADTPGYRLRIVSILGVVGRFVAAVTPLLALIGYVSLANALLWPWIASVALIGLIIVLQEFIADLYVLAKRDSRGSRDALAPVLIGFALVVGSLPFFALIWGARGSDLSEGWSRLRQGIRLGGVQLSPGTILTFIFVFAVGYFLTRVIQGTFRNSILPRTKLDAGAQNAAVSGLGYLGIFLAAMLAITSAGIDLSSLALVAGALSVGIGFGLQNIVSNFVSGIILLVERPVAVGDWIQVGNAQGYVQRISVRSTRIQTFDRTDIVVPNQDLIAKEVTNWTRGNLQGRIIVPVNVAYGADSRHVAKILMEIAEDQPTVLINPAPSVLFTGLANEGMSFEIRAVISDINQGMGVATEIRHQIIERFRREGIAIPFTVRDFYDDERRVLSQSAAISGKSADGDGEEAEDEAGQGQRRMAVASSPRRLSSDSAAADDIDPRIAGASSSGMEDAGDADGSDQR